MGVSRSFDDDLPLPDLAGVSGDAAEPLLRQRDAVALERAKMLHNELARACPHLGDAACTTRHAYLLERRGLLGSPPRRKEDRRAHAR